MSSFLVPLLLILSAQVSLTREDGGFLDVVVATPPESVAVRLTSAAPASVAETRHLTLTRGINRLRFDWSRERVDENSVRLEVKPTRGSARITARTKVQQRPGMLYFDVEASEAGAAEITARYLLHGIGWRVDYRGRLASPLPPTGDTTPGPVPESLALLLRVEVSNASGMDLSGAKLAFEGGRVESFSLPQGESRQVEVFRADAVPFTRRYVFDPPRFGASPGIEVEVPNQSDGPIGRPLLPAGRIRVFADAPDDRPALLGEDVFPATVVTGVAKFYLGHARDLVVERSVLSQVNENERRDRWNKVVAYDQRTKVRYKIRSGFPRDSTLTVLERPGAPVEMTSCGAPYQSKKAGEFEIQVDLPAGKETIVELEWVRRNLF